MIGWRCFWGGFLVTGLIVTAAGGFPGAAVWAQAKGAKNDPRQELEQLRKQLEQKKRQRQSAAKKERSILGELEELDRQIELNRRRIAILDRQLNQQSREREQLVAEVAALEQAVGRLRQAVGLRARASYMAGTAGGWGVLLGAGNYQDALIRVDALQRIAAQESSLLAEYRRQRDALRDKLRAQEEVAADMRRNRGELKSALGEIGDARTGKRTLLTKARTERSAATKAIAELEEASGQLQELLKKLEQEAQQRKKADGRLAQAKGKLPWPQDGEVVGLFGRQRHSQYNTDIYRRGIEIRSTEGAPVKAVHQGVVAYADWFKGYGLVVVLDHGDHYYTLYAHLGSIKVKVGEAVNRGQSVGEVGTTGPGTETTLYFELRHHGTPLDPLGWLNRKGKG